tara:strand:- start:344 stop:604 length:261 start_codon:yes stop_codon:yes gene_type:complete
MPKIQRDGDANSAGGVGSSSINVKANGSSVLIDGSAVSPHPGPHVGATTANGSATVFATGVPVNRTGDADSCTHPRSGGSSNVNAG